MHIEGPWFQDEHGRTLILRGVNLGGSSKVPYKPNGATHIREGFYDHRNVSFVGRPFPLAEADEHFARLRAWGFTFLRFLVTWEAVEHADNDNRWGDQWNDEDLSIFSRNQQADPEDVNSGGRALEAVVRPYARAVAGEPLRMTFDVKRLRGRGVGWHIPGRPGRPDPHLPAQYGEGRPPRPRAKTSLGRVNGKIPNLSREPFGLRGGQSQ